MGVNVDLSVDCFLLVLDEDSIIDLETNLFIMSDEYVIRRLTFGVILDE